MAHFHYVLFGTVVFAMFAGFYFWWPKMTGKMLDERLGKLHFWTLFIGFHMTFLVQHWLGVDGHAPPLRGLPGPADLATTLNDISTIGSFILGASMFTFLYNVYITWKRGEQVDGRRPVGLRQLAGVGDLLPAAAAQLHLDPADPLRAARVRPALPAHRTGPGPATLDGSRASADRRLGRMKVEAYLFAGCAIFFGVVDIVYWYFSHDPTGTTALALAVCLAFLTGFYVLFTGRRLPDAAGGHARGRDRRGRRRAGLLQPAQLVAAVRRPGRGDRGPGRGVRLVDVPHRGSRAAVLADRIRLRVLPRTLRALTCASLRAGCPVWCRDGDLRVARTIR